MAKNRPFQPNYRPAPPVDGAPRRTGQNNDNAGNEGGKELALIRPESQKAIIEFCRSALSVHKRMDDLQAKMDAIDEAYYRYTETKKNKAGGVDTAAGDCGCGNVFAADDITPPIVVAQVDTYVAYLADIFLTGSPLFPVVSNPLNQKYAEQLETLLDDHASLGAYPRHLLKFIRDAVKYNYGACEVEWSAIRQFSVSTDVSQPNGQNVKKGQKKYNKLKALDMRNTFRDPAVDPGSVSEEGDWAGYIEIKSKSKMIRMMDNLAADGKLINRQRAMEAGKSGMSAAGATNFTDAPQLNNYVVNKNRKNGVDGPWGEFFGDEKNNRTGKVPYGTQYEVVKCYARIVPRDLGLSVPDDTKIQIWRFIVVNDSVVINAERIISAYDYLPILFCQPFEDGLGDQTQSIAESEIPFQKAANTLFNIRFAAARRAVSDRALYLEDMISSDNVNAAVPAAKIPVRISALSTKKLSDAYHQIPFDMRGTETVLQDAQMIVGWSKELHGANNPRQGMFQKGNKSVREWDDTMAGSDGRMRLPALCMEYQFFSPLKSIIVLNIFQYGEDSTVVSQKSGSVLTVNLSELRKQVLAFRVSDGYTPKAKLASTDALSAGLNMIMNSPMLQQKYGESLPGIFAHMMSLMGVKDLEQYDPKYLATLQAQAPDGGAGNSNLQSNMLQGPNMPGSGVPPTQSMPLAPPQQAAPSDPTTMVP